MTVNILFFWRKYFSNSDTRTLLSLFKHYINMQNWTTLTYICLQQLIDDFKIKLNRQNNNFKAYQRWHASSIIYYTPYRWICHKIVFGIMRILSLIIALFIPFYTQKNIVVYQTGDHMKQNRPDPCHWKMLVAIISAWHALFTNTMFTFVWIIFYLVILKIPIIPLILLDLFGFNVVFFLNLAPKTFHNVLRVMVLIHRGVFIIIPCHFHQLDYLGISDFIQLKMRIMVFTFFEGNCSHILGFIKRNAAY